MTFAERIAAKRIEREAQYAREDNARQAHKAVAAQANYNEYSFTHRATGCTLTVEQARARHQQLTQAQNATSQAVRDDCLCENAKSHLEVN